MSVARRLLRSPVLVCTALSGAGAVVFTKTDPNYPDMDYDERLDAMVQGLVIFVPFGLATGVLLSLTRRNFRHRRVA